jgi:hypothetical protein
MRWLTVTAAISLAVAGFAVGEDTKRDFRFKKDDLGKVPAGWKADRTGKGEGSVWKVVADETAPSKTGFVLAQTAESPGAMFNLCVVDDTSLKDVEAIVSFKAMKGEKDQGGGIVWRYQDADNYYVARMNPLEDNFRVYKVVGGKRSKEFQDAEVKVKAGEWHTLKIKHVGDHIECFLDDKKYLDVKDASINKAGKVGLWTKADAQTYFDEFRVKEGTARVLDEEGLAQSVLVRVEMEKGKPVIYVEDKKVAPGDVESELKKLVRSSKNLTTLTLSVDPKVPVSVSLPIQRDAAAAGIKRIQRVVRN